VTGEVEQIALSPDGKTLAANVLTLQDTSVELLDASTYTIIQSFPAPLASTPLGMAFSSDGSLLALGGTGPHHHGITLWDMRAGVSAATLPEASDVVGALAFSPDGRVLAALSSDRELRLWSTQTHKVLASAGAEQTRVARLSVAFSPDGRLVATALDGDIALWDVHDPRDLAPYVRQIVEPRFVLNVVFSPDGKLLIDAEDHGPVNVRYATLAGWQSAACAIANRNLSTAEWRQFFGGQPNEPYQKVCPGM
jgi:WD40 repeat protein